MAEKKRKTLVVIDAHAMAYRAYYAMQGNLTHPVTGQPTGAIYGFYRMLLKLLLEHKPDSTAIVWDPPGGSFRNRDYPEYKANRSPMPDDLRSQIEEIQELQVKMGFPMIRVPDYEADDVMGSLAKKFGKKDHVILITGDKDCFQLIRNQVRMLRPKKGVTEFVEVDPDWVKEELGVTPDQVTDYMGLVGDSSDNIPGAKGIGPKSASKLIEEFGNLENLYKNLSKAGTAGTIKKLEEAKDLVFVSRDLATIREDVAEVSDMSLDGLKTPDLLSDQVVLLFRNEGYNQIYNELNRARENQDEGSADPSSPKKKAGGTGKQYTLVDSLSDLEALVKKLGKAKVLAVDTETDDIRPTTARLVGVSLSDAPGRAWYIALPPGPSLFSQQGISLEEAAPLLQALFQKKGLRIIGQNIKYDLLVLQRHGIQLPDPSFDTMIASYLLQPNVRRHNLDDMALDELGHDTIKYEEVTGKGKNKKTMDEIPPEAIVDYACEDAEICYQLFEKFEPRLKEQKLDRVNRDIEIPLIPVLGRMEKEGVRIDTKYFKKMSTDFEKRLEKLMHSIHEAAGGEFNINSTKELQTVLFETLNLPKGKKTKTGYSTDQSVLEELRGLHPMVDHLLEHRKLSKLRSTYLDALPLLVNPETGKIHTSFNQTIAATGRLSSNDPNLQNIPIREDAGRAIRRGFIPSEGKLLVGLDYSQIELRIMAHYSQDPDLMEAFIKDDIDIHARTGASLFGVDEKDVDPDMRSKAKVVNFSIIYGVTDFGLSQSLGIPRKEASGYIERFFERYPGVKKYMDQTVAFAEKHGYVETIVGRRRQVPEIDSKNRFRKEGAKRTAINSPIQGSSADIIKMAMIEIDREILKQNLKSRMILQVHDELLFDVEPYEKETILELARTKMESAVELKVPLRVDSKSGKNWDEVH